MSNVTALPRRSPLHPNESLPSLIYRLAALNFYDSPSVLTQVIWQGLRNKEVTRLQTETNVNAFQRIAVLTKIDVIALFQATVHCYASVLRFPGAREHIIELVSETHFPVLSSHQCSPVTRFADASLFCPACLAEALYARLPWILSTVDICLEHKCLLHTYCPGCSKRTSIHMVICGTCHRCGTDLRTAPVLSVEDDLFGLAVQHIIQHWLGIVPTSPNTLSGLPDQPPQVLYQLFQILTRVIPANADNDRQRPVPVNPLEILFAPVPVDHMYYEHRRVFEGLLDWPQGFYRWLDENTHRPTSKYAIPSGVTDNLYRKLCTSKWQHPAFQFLQDAFDVYLQERLAPTHLQRLQRFSSSRSEVV